MFKLTPHWLLFGLVCAGLALGPTPPTQADVLAPTATIGEAHDFASLVLHDPWDMNEMGDVSVYLNRSGQINSLQNIGVQNGVFSAQAIDSDPWFFTLFPGYQTAMLLDKVGARYPINRTTYHCLHIAMNVNTTSTGQIFWFLDESLNSSASNYGFANFPTVGNSWRLYTLDLNTNAGGAAWTSQAQWRGLRIDPAPTSGVIFSVDWVRLTPCTAAPLSLTNLGRSQTYDFYLVTASGEVYVRAFSTNNSGSGSVDLQGVPPGTYTWRAKQGSTVLFSGSVTINPTPVANFTRPSYTSGTDYATQAGNFWGFEDASDTPILMNFASANFASGLLNMVTSSGTANADPDPHIVLNSPQSITEASNPYRYLSVRMYTAEPIQNVPEGMIARWVWERRDAGNNACYLVSHDIPYDTGWQTITIDLYNTFNGTPEQIAGSCGGVSTGWQANTQPIVRLRFDPNENILGYPMTQQLDWIRLTKVDEVKQGQPFPIQIALNLAATAVPVQQFYYTTDPVNAPTQNVAQAYSPAPITGPYKVYMPGVRGPTTIATNNSTFMWNTAGVTPNTYYICAHVEDAAATNATISTYCSEAPVKVTP